MPFSPPYNWCDANCSRCPVATSCPLPGYEPPPAIKVELEDVLETVSPAELAAATTPSPAEQHVRTVVFTAIHECIRLSKRQLGADVAALLRAFDRHLAFIGSKMGRITPDDVEDLFDFDTAPNLLVIEHAVMHARRALAELVKLSPDAAPVAAAWARVEAVVDPYLARIRDEHRGELEQLIALRRAPSPFATTAN
jgi:hypothetical protein